MVRSSEGRDLVESVGLRLFCGVPGTERPPVSFVRKTASLRRTPVWHLHLRVKGLAGQPGRGSCRVLAVPLPSQQSSALAGPVGREDPDCSGIFGDSAFGNKRHSS